jgi:O-antigen/teichoic acid export membrane protein
MDSPIKDRRTRLKITLAAAVFLVVTTYVAIFKEMETVATTCIAGVMTVLSTYIWAETKRPSNPKE